MNVEDEYLAILLRALDITNRTISDTLRHVEMSEGCYDALVACQRDIREAIRSTYIPHYAMGTAGRRSLCDSACLCESLNQEASRG